MFGLRFENAQHLLIDGLNVTNSFFTVKSRTEVPYMTMRRADIVNCFPVAVFEEGRNSQELPMFAWNNSQSIRWSDVSIRQPERGVYSTFWFVCIGSVTEAVM